MKSRNSYAVGLALGSLTATAALLAGLSGAAAQGVAPGAPLQGAGSFPGSFLVPGTQTSLHVGGVIQFDAYEDFSSHGGSEGAGDQVHPSATVIEGPGIGLSANNGNHGIFRMRATSSRPNVETRTPTPYGELKTYWEIDFQGSVFAPAPPGVAGSTGAAGGSASVNCCGNTDPARLKQAYGTLGPWLMGMTNSLYSDLDAWPDILDGGGASGGYMINATRYEPEIRFTYLLPNGISLAAALEDYQTGGIWSTTSAGFGTVVFNNWNAPINDQKYPAAIVNGRIDQPWGHVSFHTAVAESRFEAAAPGGGVVGPFEGAAGGAFPSLPQGHELSRWGFASQLSGHINTWGSDRFSFMVSTGIGASNYNEALDEVGGGWEEDMVCSVTNGTAATGAGANAYACAQPRWYGINVGYSHHWTDEFRSGLSFGYDHEDMPSSASTWALSTAAPLTANGLAQLEKRHYSGDANLIWSPIPQAQFGIEYEYYHRVVYSGAKGDHNRIEGQALFKF